MTVKRAGTRSGESSTKKRSRKGGERRGQDIADVRKGMQGLKNKPYVLFCSHGGGGRVREVMVSLFKRIGTQVGELVAPRGWPRPEVVDQCRDLGRALAEAVM